MKTTITFLLFINLMFSQVGINTLIPNSTSILDVSATDKGMLIPRVNLTNVLSISPVATTPATSLLVWNTNAMVIGGSGIGYYFWNGTRWDKLVSSNTIATHITPHNTLNLAYNEGGLGFGRIITAVSGYVYVAGTDGFRVSGGIENVSGNYLGATSGNQMFYYPRRGAFRAGIGGWNDINPGDGSPGIGNIGTYSVAMGSFTQASGDFSVALVNNSSAEAESSVAIGNGARAVQQDDMALGQSALADGSSATAIGESAEALGQSSIAIGSAAHALFLNSMALGKSCQAEADFSTAIGVNSRALGDNSTAIGNGIKTNSFAEFALGSFNTNTPGNSTSWISTDRLFSIGNGNSIATANNAMVILKNGNIGIGIDVPTQKMDVVGTIKATNFISSTTTYPDYVFEKYYNGISKINSNYNFITLVEQEKFVKENGYLAGLKNYSEIECENMNVNLTELTIKNIEKIEELFLYITELNKENKILKDEIEKLKKKFL